MFNARLVFRLCLLPVPTLLLRAESDVILTSLPHDAKHELFTVRHCLLDFKYFSHIVTKD